MSFGGGFGAPVASSAAPAFGSFGAAAASTAAPATFGGGFGATTATLAPTGFTGFGAATSTAPAFGSFGAPAGGFGGFGSTAATTASIGGAAFGGFGGAGLARPTGLNFGTTSTSSLGTTPAFGGFGATSAFGTAISSAANPFGGGAAGGLFSQQNKPFGSTTAPAFGVQTQPFGQQPFGLQQQQQQPQAQQQQLGQVEQLYNSVVHCCIFGDERDAVLARLNMLQGSWGVGKAFFSASAPPLELTPQNPLCRFKTVGYSSKPASKNEDGFISAIVRRKATELEPRKAEISTGILNALGNRPNVKVNVDEVIAGEGDSSEVIFYVQETNPQTGQVRTVPASEAHAFLSQPMQAQHLQKLGVESLSPRLSLTDDQVQEYLNTPPQGIDHRLWKQAQLDNPDPKRLLPVPMIGFRALQQRLQHQDGQAKTYVARLEVLSDAIADLQKRHQDSLAKLRDARRKHLTLSHKVLHVMVRQEETRKIGFTIQPEEEKLRIQLEALQSEMSAPTQFKGRLNELLSQARLQSQVSTLSSSEKHQQQSVLDPYVQEDIKNVLKQQQEGIRALVTLMKDDLHDLEVITELLGSDGRTKKPLQRGQL